MVTDTVVGLHFLPSLQFAKDFHTSFLEDYFKAFEVLQEEVGWLMGEIPWDFMTKQERDFSQGRGSLKLKPIY